MNLVNKIISYLIIWNMVQNKIVVVIQVEKYLNLKLDFMNHI